LNSQALRFDGIPIGPFSTWENLIGWAQLTLSAL
jgi:hypothetical protein